MDNPWLVVVQIVQRSQNLYCVSSYDSLVKRSKIAILGLQRVRHEFQEDRRFVGLDFFVYYAAVVLYNVWVLKTSQKFAFVFEFAQQTGILSSDNLDCQMRRQITLSVVQALIYHSKRASTQLLAPLNRFQFLLPVLIYLNVRRAI